MNAGHVFIKYLLAKAASCKDFGLLVVDISVAFVHARTDEEILATQGTSERNQKSFKALAKVLMRQARDKYAVPTERHQSVYLLAVL